MSDDTIICLKFQGDPAKPVDSIIEKACDDIETDNIMVVYEEIEPINKKELRLILQNMADSADIDMSFE